MAIISADDYFMKDGKYNFDPRLLSKAHNYCFKTFVDNIFMNPSGVSEVIIMRGISGSGKSSYAEQYYCYDRARRFLNTKEEGAFPVIIDNTNLEAWEISPYIAYANMRELPYMIIEIVVHKQDLARISDRNKHGVLYSGIQKQYEKYMKSNLPPFWNVKPISCSF